MDNLKKLPGFRDLATGLRCLTSTAFIPSCQTFSPPYGYDAIDTPFLEPTEMFLRKGGGEMASQIYSFIDPGGNPVSLRPEFTSSILRWCLEEDRLAMLPLRVQYGGPVFRYRRQGDEYRQFHQAGVELIGSSDPRADAEALMLACQGPFRPWRRRPEVGPRRPWRIQPARPPDVPFGARQGLPFGQRQQAARWRRRTAGRE